MLHSFSRTELLLGPEGMKRLREAHVAVFGIGGVGSYTAEALARSGVGKLTLIDDDRICLTNINRQIIAARSTIGKQKTEAMKERILDINPDAEVICRNTFYSAANADEFDLAVYDYIVDAVDTVSAKI